MRSAREALRIYQLDLGRTRNDLRLRGLIGRFVQVDKKLL